MSPDIAPAGMLIATLVCIYGVRRLETRAKIIAEAALLGALWGALEYLGTSPLPDRIPPGFYGEWLRALAVVWWLVAARLVASISVIATGGATSRHANLFSDILAAGVYVTAAAIVLNSVLNIPVKGLLATSGIIAVVLGLALQTTLADLFSGIAVGLEQPFRIGDRISLPNDIEGIVVRMNWRSIGIEIDGENLAIIPNSLLAKDRIVNLSVPSVRREASVEVPLPTEIPSERALDLLRQAALLCSEILENPAPSVRMKRLGIRTASYSIGFNVADSPSLSKARSSLLQKVARVSRFANAPTGQSGSAANLLGGISLFSMLGGDLLETLAKSATAKALAPGEKLFSQGSEGNSLYVVEYGVLEILRARPNQAAERLSRIGPGDYIGEVSMLTGDPRPVDVRALTTSGVWELPREAIKELVRHDKRLAGALERSVRHGLSLLDRQGADQDIHTSIANGAMLDRVLTFFQRQVLGQR